ncbi:MAG: phosphomethylpyrimidine synthase ThiC [Deltaproteobacteria bacterium]|nr:phosphomethylpyrimidine synthase ThiC [Deltaproteobacteria bacterium]
MTRLENARRGIITEEMEECARLESVSPETIREGVASGRIVITRNTQRQHARPLGIGLGLSTKTNANIGTSQDHCDPKEEWEKMEVALAAGADTIMDLSTGGDIDGIRRDILARCPVPVGTVPIYQAAVEAADKKGKPLVEMSTEDIFEGIQRHVEDGVDFITVHCGITRDSLQRLQEHPRIMGMVSRGGSFTAAWMKHQGKENPLFEHFDRLLEIARSRDVTLSLGDGLRPGAVADATDRGQIQELIQLGELTLRAWKAGVQVMIEGPGHVPLNQIWTNIQIQKQLCHQAPFYVLGPLVTDIAPGYDHITSAIGGAIAAWAGADYLCYVTPSEHLGLPTVQEVREGVIAAKIAAHAADIAKGVPGALERDIEMSRKRAALDWEGQFAAALDPEHARSIRNERRPQENDVCTMCGRYCAIKTIRETYL